MSAFFNRPPPNLSRRTEKLSEADRLKFARSRLARFGSGPTWKAARYEHPKRESCFSQIVVSISKIEAESAHAAAYRLCHDIFSLMTTWLNKSEWIELFSQMANDYDLSEWLDASLTSRIIREEAAAIATNAKSVDTEPHVEQPPLTPAEPATGQPTNADSKTPVDTPTDKQAEDAVRQREHDATCQAERDRIAAARAAAKAEVAPEWHSNSTEHSATEESEFKTDSASNEVDATSELTTQPNEELDSNKPISGKPANDPANNDPQRIRKERYKWPTDPPPSNSKFIHGPVEGQIKDFAQWLERDDDVLRNNNTKGAYYIQKLDRTKYQIWFSTLKTYSEINQMAIAKAQTKTAQTPPKPIKADQRR